MRIVPRFIFLASVLVLSSLVCAQTLSNRSDSSTPAPKAAAQQPNSEEHYQQLRTAGLDKESVSVTNATIRRDAGTFNFNSGTFFFVTPVNGKVTAAVFMGSGHFSILPPTAQEQRSLILLTKDAKMDEEFDHAVFFFTDTTYDELKKLGSTSTTVSTDSASSLLREAREQQRKKLNYNIAGRLLEDVLSSDPGGFFEAMIHGRRYSDKMIFAVDPHGYDDVQPEEVALLTWSDMKAGIWTAFHLSDEYKSGAAKGTQQNGTFHVAHQKLDTAIEKNGKLSGTATATLVSDMDSLRVVPLALYPTLRVSSVTGEGGESLHFIQEDKNDDPQLFVILPKNIGKGEKFAFTTVYSGKEAVRNEGDGNYYPIARSSWYPNLRFGAYSTYEMTFRIPKNLKMVSTAELKREYNEGGENISEWASEIPQAVAGFNFGKFKRQESKLDNGMLIESYANENPPDVIKNLQNMVNNGDFLSGGGLNGNHMTGVALGTMDTTSMNKKALAEASLATQLYTDYFGTLPYKRISVTQQTAPSFGQAWPQLVYLPITYFFDSTVRHQLGMDDPRGFFKVVEPHEVAHQWWGHMVGFNSYRDQWMSEGFAELSASIYLQQIYRNGPEYLNFWKEEQQLLTEKNKEGFRAIDVGPVTMGYRLNNTKVGGIYTRLVYPKGGYILHMVRMMMWEPRVGDERFKKFMHEFTSTYANQPASTEDFKAMLEKHMSPNMDLDGNHKMDWFFDEYVYGTELPSYSFDYSFNNGDKGQVLKIKITQANVDEHFKMLVPLYLELADGRIVRLGSAPIVGNTSFQQEIPIAALKQTPKRAMLNYYYDVLSAGN